MHLDSTSPLDYTRKTICNLQCRRCKYKIEPLCKIGPPLSWNQFSPLPLIFLSSRALSLESPLILGGPVHLIQNFWSKFPSPKLLLWLYSNETQISDSCCWQQPSIRWIINYASRCWNLFCMTSLWGVRFLIRRVDCVVFPIILYLISISCYQWSPCVRGIQLKDYSNFL